MNSTRYSLALSLLLLAGCASHVEWAPDSKSLLYSHEDGSIHRYDLGTKKSAMIARVDLGERGGAFRSSRSGRTTGSS